MDERTCATALNRSGIPGADWCLNPYTGCTHACAYCYASFMQRFAGRADPWGTYVEAKANIVQVLARELRRARSGTVMISSVTDAYQPVESAAGLTRACLELLSGSGMSVSILTKSDLVVRDIDVLKSFGGLLGDTTARVGFSITTMSDELAAIIEPGATPPSMRVKALRALSDAGIPTWAFVAPALPGVADTPELLAGISGPCLDAGAAEVVVDPLNFYPTSVAGLRTVLAGPRPDLVTMLDTAARDQRRWRLELAAARNQHGQRLELAAARNQHGRRLELAAAREKSPT